MLRILSLGAGKQSTYCYLNFEYDYAIFADTQEEPRTVYYHLELLKKLKRCPILIGSTGKLGDDLIRGKNSTGQRFASIPAFTGNPGEKEGILRRECSKEYKVDVIERIIRRQILGLKPRQRIKPGTLIEQSFGISIDEAGRSRRIVERLKKSPWIKPKFPLLEQFMSRSDCIKWLNQNVKHEVPRSACVFCPYHSDEEWLYLKEHDAYGWARAVQIDEALRKPGIVANRNMEKPIFLHRSLKPLAEIDFEARIKEKRPVPPLFAQECEGMCGT